MTTIRHRLPNRRPAVTEEIDLGNRRLTATIGFCPEGRPAEVFLSGPKDGTDLAAILADAAVVISIALQHGISAAVLRKSISRLPESLDGAATAPASPIGAALDLLARYERGRFMSAELETVSPKRTGLPLSRGNSVQVSLSELPFPILVPNREDGI
jgi:hypothetical protein